MSLFKLVKRDNKQTLVNKFTLIIGVSIFITTFFMSAYYLYSSSILVRQNRIVKENNHKAVASVIFQSYKEHKSSNDVKTEKIVDQLKKSGLILFSSVIDLNTKKYLWSSEKALIGTEANTGNIWSNEVFQRIFHNVAPENLKMQAYRTGDKLIIVGFYDNDVLIAALNILFNGNITLALVFIIFGFASALVLARIVTRPIQDLATGAEEFSRGNLKYRAQAKTNDEIGRLAEAFNIMAEKLDELYTSLEQQVKDRTGELTIKNDELENAYKELKEAQALLIHNEKMSSLGQLVAGIAHELNNPINFIYGNMAHLKNYSNDLVKIIEIYDEFKSKLPDEDQQSIDATRTDLDYEFIVNDLSALMKSCKDGAERCKQIVLDLKNFSRLDEAVLKEVDIHEGIDSTLNILTNKYKNKITVNKNYGDIPKLTCLAGQLNQVFMNILDNASQAIKEQGEVNITTKFENNDIIIMIEDNGAGIEQDYLSKIFDPFFTTKPVGEGTGLGLSISYKIIKNHNGVIDAESEIGKGTKFTIKIPIDWHENRESEQNKKAIEV